MLREPSKVCDSLLLRLNLTGEDMCFEEELLYHSNLMRYFVIPSFTCTNLFLQSFVFML